MAGSHAHRPGHGTHGHGDTADRPVPVARGPRTVLLGLLAVAGLLTIVGVVGLWPDGEKVDSLSREVSFAAPGVTFPRADVLAVQPACQDLTDDVGCGRVTVQVTEGVGVG